MKVYHIHSFTIQTITVPSWPFLVTGSRSQFYVHVVRQRIRNYLRLQIPDTALNANQPQQAHLNSFDFPESITFASLEYNTDPMKSITFEPKICHRCNIAIPRLRYCHPMYGGEFKQTFGWYINQALFRSGVDRWLLNYLPDVCPPDIQELVNKLKEDTDRRNKIAKTVQVTPEDAAIIELHEIEIRLQKQKRKIKNIFENETRMEFGIRKIGEAWVSENILFQIIIRLFSNHECLRHYRPPWLEGLELDIFIPTPKIAFEYQGQQHFHPIEHWGGRASLDFLKQRDARKAKLCRLHGILLIPIDYTEPLTENHIRTRIGMND